MIEWERVYVLNKIRLIVDLKCNGKFYSEMGSC